MTFIYEQPRQITFQEKDYIKQAFLSMLNQSKEEFNKWKSNKNEVFLKQACQKVFAAIEHFFELKKNIDITRHYQFRREFRAIKGINRNTIERLIDKSDSLHQYFYNGQMYESDVTIMEQKYLDIYNYLKDKVREL